MSRQRTDQFIATLILGVLFIGLVTLAIASSRWDVAPRSDIEPDVIYLSPVGSDAELTTESGAATENQLFLTTVESDSSSDPISTDNQVFLTTVEAGSKDTAVVGQPFAPGFQLLTVPLFQDVTQNVGIEFTRQGGDKLIGQAWADVNQDGWLDLYITDSGGPNQLYENVGDGTFRVSPLAADVALADAESSGAVFADYDNDGWADLFVLNVGENKLYHNDEGQRFIDVTAVAGVGDTAHAKTASWGDYDADGFLDLYVANWSCSPRCGRPMEGDKDRLYRNNGDGTFTDVTDALSRPRGAGFVASFTDYDNDGDLDIYLVNDTFINPIGNVLWRNEGTDDGCQHWCFTDVSAAAGADSRVMGMGLASADYDNDGDIDYYFSNVGPMVLLQNQGDGTFADVARQTGTDLGKDHIGWGAIFFDYDNDGWQDIYLAISDKLPAEDPADALFRNDQQGGFMAVEPAVSGLDSAGRTLGVAYADYDNDGWLDLIIGNFDEGYRLYRNNGAQLLAQQNRISVHLTGDESVNRDAVGSRVTVVLDDGRSQMQEVISGSSLGAGNTLALQFGLGEASISQLHIRWPDGLEQSFTGISPNQRYAFKYPSSPSSTE